MELANAKNAPSGEDMLRRPTGLTTTALLMFLTAAGTLVFWINFVNDVGAQRQSYLASRCESWFTWERSFPLADAWIVATAMAGAVGLWYMRESGLLFGLVGGGAMVFLGLADALFFLQNDLYRPLTSEVAIELFIHAWMIGFGLAAIASIWRHRALIRR